MTVATIGETQQRFLRAVFERVPLERVAELHLFTPVRQGGVESGLAVLAAWPGDEEPALEFPPEATDEEQCAVVGTPAVSDMLGPEADASAAAVEQTEPARTLAPDEGQPGGDFDTGEDIQDLSEVEGVEDIQDASGVETGTKPPVVRHVVYTARYRLVLKGPDRGQWEVDVRDEADAPLVTVDAVVRGVQRRIGDIAEVERLGPEQMAIAVSDTPWRSSE